MFKHHFLRRCALAIALAASLGPAPRALGADSPAVFADEEFPTTYAGWRVLLSQLTALDEFAAVRHVNAFINRLPAAPDRSVWGREDHWATPRQLFARGRGDCEDFALAKYHSLLHLGVPPRRLWLGYSRVKRPDRLRIEAHMVLIYEDRGSRRWVLDNLRSAVTMVGRRSDIAITVGVNATGLWQLPEGSAPVHVGGPERLPAQTRAMLEPDTELVSILPRRVVDPAQPGAR